MRMTNEEAIAWLEHHFDPLPDGTKQSEAVSLAIKALEQEPKTGHWIRHDNGKYHWYLCSYCDAMAGSDEKMMAYKYCPNCGCRMVEPQESEVMK